MMPRLPLALALTGLIGAGVFVTSQLATAEQSQSAGQSQQSEAASPKERFVPSPADRAAFLEARIAALHAGLTLTPDQEKLWPPVESALRDLVKARAAMFQKMREFRNDEHPVDPITRLKRISDHQIARGEALKKVADAAAPLYAALNDEQKRRLPVLLHALRPHHHHHHFAAGEEGGERGPGWHHGEHERFGGDREEGPGWERR
jgi:zinc resistance-associated protein